VITIKSIICSLSVKQHPITITPIIRECSK
jgi:hypothetical protein